MTQHLAADYADSLLREIEANDAAGTPFGIVTDDNPVTDRENGDEISALDYLSDVLSISVLCSYGRNEYESARVLIAFGGPNAWIDTRTRELEVTWDERVTRNLPAAFCDAIDDAISETWTSR